MTKPTFVFFLGGADLEMQEIGKLLRASNWPVHDAGLRWGARASAYAAEIEATLARGEQPVLIELIDDMGAFTRGALRVDHHGELAGADRPCSLRQVVDLICLPATAWTRHFDLVAANDVGGLDGLLAAGAMADEARAIKHADYAAQGLDPTELLAAQQAARQAVDDGSGGLLLANCPNDRSLALADALHPLMGGPGFANLLVRCPNELAFLGEGARVQRLASALPGGWWGGALPRQGFWGHADPGLFDAALAVLQQP